MPSKRNETETEPRVVSLSFLETDKMLPRKMHQSEERIYYRFGEANLAFSFSLQSPKPRMDKFVQKKPKLGDGNLLKIERGDKLK